MRQTSSEAVPARLCDEQDTHRVSDGVAPATENQSANEIVAPVFREYNESLVRYLSVRLHSVRDAEEVAQEAYARMLKLDEPGTISHLQGPVKLRERRGPAAALFLWILFVIPARYNIRDGHDIKDT